MGRAKSRKSLKVGVFLRGSSDFWLSGVFEYLDDFSLCRRLFMIVVGFFDRGRLF